MFNTIFQKQLTLYIGALVFSFSLLGVATSMAFNDYFIKQKAEMLQVRAKKIASYAPLVYDRGFYTSAGIEQINRELYYMREYLDSNLFLLDDDFRVETATQDLEEYKGTVLNIPEIEPVLRGEIVTLQGRLNGIFNESYISIGYPIVFDRQIIGVVLLNASIPEIQQTVSDVFRITLTCLVISAVLASVLIFIFSRSISRPLQQINDAARVIASGDFEKRIDLESKDEIGQLAGSFNNMAESLYRQEESRRDFISNISHDLRSPLTSMRGFLQAVLDGTVPKEKNDYYLGIVMSETERLSKLANDILDLNKAQSFGVGLDRTDFDINELIRKTALKFETQVTQKNIQLSLSFADKQSIINADYEKIERVLYNLMDNAVKFTEEGGKALIGTDVIEGKVRITVENDGHGMTAEEQKRVFDRFFKVDSSRGEDKQGSGLGLAIVRAFIKEHGENIRLISAPGKGCKFFFELPLSQAEEEQ